MELSKRCVFVCRDFVMGHLLDDIAVRLQAHGMEVVRGPESRPGEKLSYPPETWERYFGRAEVAMFSTRNPCSREMLQWAPRLVGIVNPTIGLDSVDVAAATEMGIIVGHGATPENFTGMAEATVLLMLMLLYKPDAARGVLRGQVKRPPPGAATALARSMAKRTVGLVGFGRIARAVAHRLEGWDVRILTAHPTPGADRLPPHVTRVDLATLLAESDLVSLHFALTAENRGLIGEAALARMKPTAYLVNTSRGDAVDEAALICALRERRLAGAALDVFAVEPLPQDSPLRSMENVILTPHMIGHTAEVFDSIGPAAEENILRVLRGQLPTYCKNPEAAGRFHGRYARLLRA